jgi:hypothetical protein
VREIGYGKKIEKELLNGEVTFVNIIYVDTFHGKE